MKIRELLCYVTIFQLQTLHDNICPWKVYHTFSVQEYRRNVAIWMVATGEVVYYLISVKSFLTSFAGGMPGG